MWRAERTPEGPATCRIAWRTGEVVATAWGPGADHVLARVPAMVGLEDTPEAFQPTDALMAELVRRFPGLRLGRGRRIIDVLVVTILGQRVTTGEAQSAYRRMVFKHSERAPGPNKLWLPPDPARLRRLRPYEIMGDDLDAKRAATILRACMHYKKLDKRQHEPGEEVAAFLQKLPGIGPWTANLTIGQTHGWADAVPVGDFHIPHMVTFALAGEPRGTDERMLELLEPYAGHRNRAIKLLGAAGARAPRYGARKASWAFYVDRGTRRRGGG